MAGYGFRSVVSDAEKNCLELIILTEKAEGCAMQESFSEGPEGGKK